MIIAKLDRLTRSVKDLCELLERFELFTFHFLSSLIEGPVQEGFNFQSGSRARPRNVPQHNIQSLEGLGQSIPLGCRPPSRFLSPLTSETYGACPVESSCVAYGGCRDACCF